MVEGLPWDRFSDDDAEVLSHIPVHLIDQEEHGDVHFQVQPLLPFCNTVEAAAVVATEIDGHHIAMILDALSDERLLPWQVMDMTVDEAGVESCREHQDMVVTTEALFYDTRKAAGLFASLVDTDAHRLQSWQEEQQIVDQIAEPAIVVPSDDRPQAHTVLSTQGMVGYKDIALSVVLWWQIVQALYRKVHTKILHTLLQPHRTFLVAVLPQKCVDLVLVNDAAQPIDKKARYKLCLAAHLAF